MKNISLCVFSEDSDVKHTESSIYIQIKSGPVIWHDNHQTPLTSIR